MKVIEFTEKGLYCPIADFYIDPWKPVEKAFITHGHSDHARRGHKQYFCTSTSVPILKHRLGAEIKVKGVPYLKKITKNGVNVSFHPAGHIIGSAQIKVEYKGEIWVISGDYKTENDGISEAFEPVKCHHFITECTFGLPVYDWSDQSIIYKEIDSWWSNNIESGKTTILCAYSLGKAQRLIQNINNEIGPVYTHAVIENLNRVLRKASVPIRETISVMEETNDTSFQRGIVIAPPSAINSSWIKRFSNPSIGIASGWMALRGARRRRAADRGFCLSDHCDWKGLNSVIKETGATHIYPTHGYTDIFTQWLKEQGYFAKPVQTEFSGEQLDEE